MTQAPEKTEINSKSDLILMSDFLTNLKQAPFFGSLASRMNVHVDAVRSVESLGICSSGESQKMVLFFSHVVVDPVRKFEIQSLESVSSSTVITAERVGRRSVVAATPVRAIREAWRSLHR